MKPSLDRVFVLVFQIAAKIGGDGVPAAPSGNEFGYGGQKRPLEDAGEYGTLISYLRIFAAPSFACTVLDWTCLSDPHAWSQSYFYYF